jgi:fucose 4-O-acetylase-like acetyltransferase
VLGYLASLQPSIYSTSSFWTSSPTFFFIRVGLVTMMLPIAWMAPGWSVIEALGRSSLFVYWIHVEMVYGIVAEPIKRTLPLEGSLVATGLLCTVLYALVRLKDRWKRSGSGLAAPAPAAQSPGHRSPKTPADTSSSR